jgi:hypothetical protein
MTPVPLPPRGHIYVAGIAAISPRAAFAVGAIDPFYIHAQALRSDGHSWRLMPTPRGPDTDSTLGTVAALSARPKTHGHSSSKPDS